MGLQRRLKGDFIVPNLLHMLRAMTMSRCKEHNVSYRKRWQFRWQEQKGTRNSYAHSRSSKPIIQQYSLYRGWCVRQR
uniref:Uncharacterized protein n=1 Tax=Arundo donax TaxID=35708 RepID=A0A0A9GHD1_ARUDO